jgi:ribosome biogenesis GTPase A
MLKIVCFNSFTIFEQQINPEKKRKMSAKRRKYATAVGRRQLFDAIEFLNLEKGGKPVEIDRSDLEQREVLHNDSSDEEEEDEDKEEDDKEVEQPSIATKEEEEKKVSSSTITLGCVGHPNVGKSSLINGLMGTKVVSASRTPGHTKHLQTIYLTKQVVLCDCPGLVFPALDRPKALQILCGLFPIAQVRESYSAIRYLAERVPVEKIYGLHHPDQEEKHWTPYYICEAYANKRGYYLKKGRPDVHRAGLEILKDCVDGVISISWPPPGVDVGSIPEPNTKRTNEKDQDADVTSSDVVMSKAMEKKIKKKLRKQRVLEEALATQDK